MRYITGLPSVHHRDEKRLWFLAADRWADAFLSLETFFMQHMSGNLRQREQCFFKKRTTCFPDMLLPVESKNRTYHGRIGSERPAERPGGVVQNCMPTELFAQDTKFHRSHQGIKKTTPERLSRSTKSEILCKPTEKQNLRLTRGLSPVYHRFITCLSAGREARFVPGCKLVERRLFIF